jgi:hypothetical protein
MFFFQPSEAYIYSFICEWTWLRKGHTHPLLADISWEISCRQNIGGYMIYLCPILGFPTVLFCWNFKAIARMHGTFYRDTTPIHVALMAKAHKVCNHPRNIAKDKTLLGIEWHDGQLNHFHVKWDTESDAPHKICCSAIGSP